jgi:hypothetical protein
VLLVSFVLVFVKLGTQEHFLTASSRALAATEDGDRTAAFLDARRGHF